MTEDPLEPRPMHRAACHCGTVRFTVRLSDGLRTARRCNCSFCSMRGAVMVLAARQDIAVTEGRDALTLYQFNTHEAKHWFCNHCGIYTFHQRRSSPDQYGVNVACLEGLGPFDFAEVPVVDGLTHAKDRPGGQARIAGRVSYEPDPTSLAE